MKDFIDWSQQKASLTDLNPVTDCITHKSEKDNEKYFTASTWYRVKKAQAWENWNKNKVKSKYQIKELKSAEEEMTQKKTQSRQKWWKKQRIYRENHSLNNNNSDTVEKLK